MVLFNLKNNKERRRYLRRKMTDAEVILWKELRNKKIGYKFRRQYGIGSYIIDFYCPQLKFGIELDGDVHALNNVYKKDLIRDKFLNECGIIIKRFWNHEIFEEIDSVLEVIVHLCQYINDRNLKVQLSHSHSPSKIRGRYRGS
jgi:very-short-patch-repair endonuclease